MYFVDNNTGTTEMPALAPSQGTEVKWFTEGDGNKGISHIGQDWLNIIQAELLAILTEGKIQPDKTKLNQLTLAIKAIITANAFSRKNNLKEIQDAGADAQTNARKALGLGGLATKDKLSSTDVGALEKSKNLSDVPDKATARTNIEVYSKTEGDGRYLRKDQNLKDVGNAATARKNLSVYSKSDVYTKEEGDNRYLRKDQNGADVADKSTFIDNLGLRETVNKAANALPSNGTAVAANRLANAHTINGVPFDGTQDINITSGMTQSTADGRYVQNVQLGAESYHSPGSNVVSWTYRAPSGCMLSGIGISETGSNSSDNVNGVYYRAIQIYINGYWRTVSSI
ncbi:phage tail protein [Escherichia coli]|nr:phage tail protein [Escherichia coli]